MRFTEALTRSGEGRLNATQHIETFQCLFATNGYAESDYNAADVGRTKQIDRT
jgi:hypothetical protein